MILIGPNLSNLPILYIYIISLKSLDLDKGGCTKALVPFKEFVVQAYNFSWLEDSMWS